MSIIKKIFGAFLAFVSSILGIFTKKKKKGEFYLEIDPSKESAAATAPAKKVAPAAKSGKASEAATDSAPAVTAPPKPQAPSATDLIVAAVRQPTSGSATAQALNMPGVKVTSSLEPLDIPKFGPRRRPGSNMQSFLDMAKTVKS